MLRIVEPTPPLQIVDAAPTKTVKTGPLAATDYQLYTQKQHIYEVTDTYIGSDEKIARTEWLYDFTSNRMVPATITVPQGVERLFLEIVSNAGDNSARSWGSGIDPGQIDVHMDRRTIIVRNGGTPIPVEMHPQHGIWVPQMIFGTLLTSSNYDKTVIRMGCGRNGYGAKLVNIFSKLFTIEIGDPIRKLKYTQIWQNNMDVRHEPAIVPYEGPAYVQIAYEMDFARFGYTEYPDEAFNLFARFVLDFSFTCKVPVTFNGQGFNLRSIRDYSALYLGEVSVGNSIVHYEWPLGVETYRQARKDGGAVVARDPTAIPMVELCIVDAPDNASIISFVNGIMTVDGGVHVDAVHRAVSTSLLAVINGERRSKKKKVKETGKKDDSPKLTVGDIKPHLSIILSCRLPDPKYKSQTKTMLASPRIDLAIPDETLNPILKWSVIDRLYAALEAKQYKKLAGTDGRKRRHVKLEKADDANDAGTARSSECTLMIVEGMSAMGYARIFQSLVPQGRDTIGILPLKGKPLNVLNADPIQIAENAEIIELKKMLGLQEGMDYTIPTNRATLRYGHILISADQDNDGSHIKALLMLFFGARFPSIIQIGMLMYLNTPRLRVFKGTEVKKFYSPREYEAWRAATPDFQSWRHKYYKGLGTSKKADIQDDFAAPRYVTCYYDDRTQDALRLAFDERFADQRKQWITQWQGAIDIEDVQMQPISQFIYHELIEYSIENLSRSIPKLLDGLKESQRKILWAAFKKWESESKSQIMKSNPQEIKVERFAQFASEKTNYHHGGRILEDVTVTMAQDFVGANNLPFFQQDGIFGTRNEGGKDCAEARYAETRPEWWLNYVFKKEDLPLHTMVIDEGEEVEPVSLLPIIPLQLINGGSGVATGFSTFLPNHDVLEVCEALKCLIQGQEAPELVPKYRGFKGTIALAARRAPGQATIIAAPETEEADEMTREDIDDEEQTAEALELQATIQQAVEAALPTVGAPPRMSMVTTGCFEQVGPTKVVITELPIGRWTTVYKKWLEGLRENKVIKEVRDLSTDDTVRFEIDGMKDASVKKLRLTRTYGLTNMVLLNNHNRPVRYENANAILRAFYEQRLPYYESRRNHIMEVITGGIRQRTDKIRFIAAVVGGQLQIMNRPKRDVLADMETLGIPTTLYTKVRASAFSVDEIAELQREIQHLNTEHQIISDTSAAAMWIRDLEEFELAYCRRNHLSVPQSMKMEILRIPLPAAQ